MTVGWNLVDMEITISIHTLTQRVTKTRGITGFLKSYFNPHPHAEGDGVYADIPAGYHLISIHTLTQRVTCSVSWGLGCPQHFNPHPHAEGDDLAP